MQNISALRADQTGVSFEIGNLSPKYSSADFAAVLAVLSDGELTAASEFGLPTESAVGESASDTEAAADVLDIGKLEEGAFPAEQHHELTSSAGAEVLSPPVSAPSSTEVEGGFFSSADTINLEDPHGDEAAADRNQAPIQTPHQVLVESASNRSFDGETDLTRIETSARTEGALIPADRQGSETSAVTARALQAAEEAPMLENQERSVEMLEREVVESPRQVPGELVSSFGLTGNALVQKDAFLKLAEPTDHIDRLFVAVTASPRLNRPEVDLTEVVPDRKSALLDSSASIQVEPKTEPATRGTSSALLASQAEAKLAQGREFELPATTAPTDRLAPNPTPNAMPQSQLAHQVNRQLVVSIQNNPTGTTEIRLDPPELGNVRVSVSHTESSLLITLVADRADTSEMLRRHVAVLSESLRSAGFAEVNIQLPERGQQSFDRRGQGQAEGDSIEVDPDGVLEIVERPTTKLVSLTGLDLRL
ncbi:flagellar hook-length control protein FliK [Pelagovum pacificum]|uniref:Flagellar hook-length control protein FliK n=1 Tax=Pelagovum pacificum TaxID=2588711 RepID=A0A5C5GGP4_9RHOB|nr:flagellar hook-length control protein FliK [Pelagovum pacificum]QQA42992.1 flagellar hook-length control protein FliK [Pelagovum pacificum]TNY33863.1 flagellar hook-length control protein FliK [Pelagovum pacificum]